MTTQRLRRTALAVLAISLPAVLGLPGPLTPRADAASGMDAAVVRSLDVDTLVSAAPAKHREAVRFLAEHMPTRDREALDQSFVLGHVAERMEARDRAPWGASLPDHLFHNDVLPYAIASETRERLDPAFIERCRRITANATTPGEAALALNAALFGELGVKYGTSRRRPDQSVSETCEQGVATCTGLSVLLVQACRAVAVPARIAGVASWSDDRGNHTWVEAWDGESWRFVGAAEPDGRGFDHGWFTGDASKAVPGHPRYAVVATSWAPTDRHFPMVWAPRDRSVPGVDVTRRYLRGEAAGDPDTVRVMVRMLGADGRRVVGDVQITGADIDRTVTTLGPEADMNRHAEIAVAPGTQLRVVGRTADGTTATAEVDLATASAGETRLVTLRTAAATLSDADRTTARAWFDTFFAASADEQVALAAAEHPLDARLRTPEGDAALREIAFAAWRAAPIHADTAADMAANRVRAGGYESPYTVKQVGERPAGGWGLVIAMHGGGGVPKRVNDSQWDVMKRYYRDQPDAGGYIYVALRAPTDEWNGFYTGYIYPVIEQLIAQFVVHRDVDPQRVHAIGYSHGGYGAYAIGPNLPHRFAAVHASAAAATGGETVAESLMNLRFTAMIGELDTAYGRVERNREFSVRLAELKAATDPDLYPGGVTEIAGNGHGGLPDRDWLIEMLPHERNTSPERLWWKQTGGQVTGHYWLADRSPQRGGDVQASRAGNTITIEMADVDSLELRLDARVIDPNAPLQVRTGEAERTVRVSPRLGTLAATLFEMRDPKLAATIVLPVASPE